MNYFDIVVGIILIIAIIKGFKNGLILELASLIALILGVLGAILLSSWAETFIRQWWDWKYLGAVAFLITFIGIVLGIHLLAKLINEMVKLAALNTLNRILGAVFSMFKYAFIVSILFSVIDYFRWSNSIMSSQQQESSKLYIPITKFAPTIFPYLKFEKEISSILPNNNGVEI
ncbi:MAG: CvpA family protein [Marinilabiliaceae bacterium]|nr:CvpA family protein [Marinilabiliaceae bacterium]